MSSLDQESGLGVSSGTSPVESNSTNATVRVVEKAVSQLELARTYIERDLDQARSEMRDVRDRLKAVEVKVDALPSKIWIGSVVIGAMTILSIIFGAVVALVRILAH